MSFAIQSKDGRHLGFLLLAGGPVEGDCVFRSLPFESEGFDLRESEYLYELQQKGEFRWADVGDRNFRIEDPSSQVVAEINGGQMASSGHEFLFVPLKSKE